MNLLSTVVVFLFIFQIGFCLNPLPDFVEVCRKSAPDHSECMNKNVMAFQKEIVTGNPAYDIPCLEPFAVENFIVSERSSSNQLQISATHVEIYNASKYISYNFKTVEVGKEYTFNVNFSSLYVKATYNIDGQIIVLPIKGSGPMTAEFLDVATTARIKIGTRTKNGVKSAKMLSVSITMDFKDGHVKLENLFNGDKAIGDAVNDAINANIKVLSKDLTPIVYKALNREFRKSADQIIRRYTNEQLFPE